MLQFLAENPGLIVAATAAVEILRGNGGRMGEQIKEGIANDPLGKIMMAVMMAAMFWVGTTTQSNSVQLATLEQKVDNFISDRFTGSQAALLDQRLRRVEAVLDRLSDQSQVR